MTLKAGQVVTVLNTTCAGKLIIEGKEETELAEIQKTLFQTGRAHGYDVYETRDGKRIFWYFGNCQADWENPRMWKEIKGSD